MMHSVQAQPMTQAPPSHKKASAAKAAPKSQTGGTVQLLVPGACSTKSALQQITSNIVWSR